MLVFCVLSLTQPRDAKQRKSKHYWRYWNWSTSWHWIILLQQCWKYPAWGTADGAGSGGSASETAGPLLGEEVVGLCQGNNELRYPFPPGCPHFMYQNATCRIPSALHSLTAGFPNNRWEFWVRSWRSAIKVFNISSQGNFFIFFFRIENHLKPFLWG